MPFCPEEILFSPTENCNLSCLHCTNVKSKTILSKNIAKRFLVDCKKIGIDRVGFTGGEPFLAIDFLCDISRTAAKEEFLFDRVMTNGVWYKNISDLGGKLRKLFDAGYDGSICVSVDAFHRQSPGKVARFIKAASDLSGRPDIVSIACVRGALESSTKKKIKTIAALLGGCLTGFKTNHPHIKTEKFFIKIYNIELSPIGRASVLKDPWDGRWFKEDYCKGPGNVFFITSSGDVKPCCGYASDLALMTIGNIRKDSPDRLMKKFREKRLVCAIFNTGLARLRSKLIKEGVVFPGKTSNHCFFCRYIMTEVPKCVLEKCIK